jgi:hypothetical protein
VLLAGRLRLGSHFSARIGGTGEIEQEADVAGQRDPLFVGKADVGLAVVAGDYQILAADRCDVVDIRIPRERLLAFLIARYSTQAGNTFIATTATAPITSSTTIRPDSDTPASLPILVGRIRASASQWIPPMRFRLPKFIQTNTALPTMFWSGTKPQ